MKEQWKQQIIALAKTNQNSVSIKHGCWVGYALALQMVDDIVEHYETKLAEAMLKTPEYDYSGMRIDYDDVVMTFDSEASTRLNGDSFLTDGDDTYLVTGDKRIVNGKSYSVILLEDKNVM